MSDIDKLLADARAEGCEICDALADEIQRLRTEVRSREDELLRVRTGQHGGAHAIDNIGIELGLGANATPLDVQAAVRKLRAEPAEAVPPGHVKLPDGSVVKVRRAKVVVYPFNPHNYTYRTAYVECEDGEPENKSKGTEE